MYIIPFAAVLVASSSAFTSPIHSLSRMAFQPVSSISIPTRSNNVLQMVDGNDDTPRKRRKRKDGQQFSPPSSSTITEKKDDIVEVAEIEAEVEDVQDTQTTTPKENVVVMQVRDIQDVVSGEPEAPVIVVEERVTVKKEEILDDDDDDDELADDEEWEYFDVDQDGNEIIASEEQQQNRGRGQDESIEQLLADARSMRKSSSKVVDEETPLKEKILEAVANIVTVDFFVVIALLLWFLAGIFCSYVLKDDTVQIAFNMNFERVTQP